MKGCEIFFLPHTHWDRDWYLPFQVFRSRLANMMGQLLKLLDEFPEFRFTLDGQVVALEDYLEVEKDKHRIEKLFSMIRNGRISVGPFYVLPDEFLISGETFVRNFLVAQKVLKELSLPSMTVAYLPDMFGHSAYIPTLVKGLGLRAVLIWRGVGDSIRDTEFIWKGPDGSEILCINIIRSYWNLGNPPKEYEKFKEVVEKEVALLAKHSPSGCVLLMAGNDHRFPFPLLPEFVKKLNAEGYSCRIVTLEEYVQNICSLNLQLRSIEGEMRDPKYAPILKDVASSRIYLKQRSHTIEKELINTVEPLSAVAHLWNLPIDKVISLIFYTWKLFLKTLPHDDICGCSIDQVHREMSITQDQVFQLIKSIKAELMDKIVRKLNGEVCWDYNNEDLQLFVFSPFERRIRTVVEKEIRLPEDFPDELFKSLVVLDNDRVLPTVVQYIGQVDFEGLSNSFNTFEEEYLAQFLTKEAPPHFGNGKVVRIKFEAELPPLGFKTFGIKFGSGFSQPREIEERHIETSFIRVKINKDGTLTVEDKRTGRIYSNLFYLEDSEDVGDEYNYSPSENPEVITTLEKNAEILSVSEDPIHFSVDVLHILELPESFDFKNRIRSSKKVTIPIKVRYLIYKKAPRIDVKIEFENKAKDHRLRVRIPLPVSANVNISDDYFGSVTRPNKVDVPENPSEYSEVPEPRYPMQNFVYIADEQGGIVLSTKGLKEYETIQENGTLEVALTVLRSVGMLSRPGLLTRNEDAGPSFSTPEAQCIRNHVAEFSIYFTDKQDLSEAYSFSREYQLSPTAFIVRNLSRTEILLLSVEPRDLILSTFKVAEDGKGVIVRLYNVGNSEVEGIINLGWTPTEIFLTNIAEKPLKKIEPRGNTIRLKVNAKETVTLKIV